MIIAFLISKNMFRQRIRTYLSNRILNRIISWTDNGIEYEADQRHAEIIVKQMGLKDNSKGVVTPGIRVNPADKCETKLGKKGASVYRGIVARANYLAQDRTDIKFAVKELSRNMSEPTIGDVDAAKRFARYLSANLRMVSKLRWQNKPGYIEGWSETLIGRDVCGFGNQPAAGS